MIIYLSFCQYRFHNLRGFPTKVFNIVSGVDLHATVVVADFHNTNAFVHTLESEQLT